MMCASKYTSAVQTAFLNFCTTYTMTCEQEPRVLIDSIRTHFSSFSRPSLILISLINAPHMSSSKSHKHEYPTGFISLYLFHISSHWYLRVNLTFPNVPTIPQSMLCFSLWLFLSGWLQQFPYINPFLSCDCLKFILESVIHKISSKCKHIVFKAMLESFHASFNESYSGEHLKSYIYKTDQLLSLLPLNFVLQAKPGAFFWRRHFFFFHFNAVGILAT